MNKEDIDKILDDYLSDYHKKVVKDYIEEIESKLKGNDIFKIISLALYGEKGIETLNKNDSNIWVNSLLEFISENNIKFGSDKDEKRYIKY